MYLKRTQTKEIRETINEQRNINRDRNCFLKKNRGSGAEEYSNQTEKLTGASQ